MSKKQIVILGGGTGGTMTANLARANPGVAPRRSLGEWINPRQESNLRTRFRKPLLYPLSYGGPRPV